MLLTLHTTLHRVAVQHHPDFELRQVAANGSLLRADERGRPLLRAELGVLLDPRDQPAAARQHALIVPLRRRSVALLFQRVGALHEVHTAVAALPPLLARRLRHSWVLGVSLLEDVPTLVLDPRQLAQHVVRQFATIQG
jgi:hypothetical protein